jgi:8-oxo-dGTP pyrophosphatase MutT (NUDIX family)
VDTQRKVTCFVTRGDGDAAELCVFWHELSGVQVPAGTVEDGETFEEGARREAREETALEGLQLAACLGSRMSELNETWSVLRREVALRVHPDASTPVTQWTLARNLNISVVDRQDGFARVVFAERDLEDERGLVLARFEGWVAEADLFARQERRFYHFRAPAGSPDSWQTIENGAYELHLYWVPLRPKPGLLRACQEWLDEFYDALLAAVGAS